MREAHGYWYSLVAASPIPESGEAVNIAVAFGNGQLINIDFDERLSRLQGLMSADHRALYAGSLRVVKDSIARGLTIADVAHLLGPQFTIGEPRPLELEYSDSIIRALRKAYLTASPSPREQADSYLKRSLRTLDHYYRDVDHAAVQYVRGRYSLADLYEHKLDRYVTVKVPPVRRMIRASERDVLLNTLIIRPETPEKVLDNYVARVSRQFYAFKELEGAIKKYAGREVRRVGIIQPLRKNATRSEVELANWVSEVWGTDAQVLRPAEPEQIKFELKNLVDWSRAA